MVRTKNPVIILPLILTLFSSPSYSSESPTELHQKAFHLLNRLSYGPRPGELEALIQSGDAGMEKWIQAQLHPESISDSDVETQLKKLSSLTMTIPELRKAFPKADKKNKKGLSEEKEKESAEDTRMHPRRILMELIFQKIIRAAESKRQLQEVLEDFWFNHFNVDFNKGQVKWLLTSYERDTIRPHIFGKFRDLLGAVAKSPAMLFYLDNFKSVRDGMTRPDFLNGVEGVPKVMGLNENYGRELLELHTLGVDGGYTQNDVRESARALTGWSLEQPQRETEFKFRPRTHDLGEKHIFGLTLPANERMRDGIKDGELLLDHLARHPSTAHFIATKLCIKFISDHPPRSAVKKLSETFLRTDGDLRAVYTQLFHLPEFWAKEARRSKIKTPWEFIVSAVRALNGEVNASRPRPGRILLALQQMGEPLYQCQPPTGFKATSEYWVNPGALVTRINFALALAQDRLPEIDTDIPYFKKRWDAASSKDWNSALDLTNELILGGELSSSTRKLLLAELNSEEKVVSDSDAHAGREAEHHASLNWPKLLGLMVGSPEFQRR